MLIPSNTVAWAVHTGPFPIVAPRYDGEIWLWRITDATHYTAVTVKFARAIGEADPERIPERVREAHRTRGRVELERCLRWHEPPREIAFEDLDGEPCYWGGHRSALTT